MRNLLQEFANNPRVSPVSIRSLVGDWVYRVTLSNADLKSEQFLALNIAPEVAELNFTIAADGPHNSGRIVYVTATQLRGQPKTEVRRGMTLGEAYDMLSMLTPLEVFCIASQFIPRSKWLTSEQYADDRARQQRFHNDALSDAAQAHRKLINDGQWTIRQIPSYTSAGLRRMVPTLYWISNAGIEYSANVAAAKVQREETQYNMRFCRNKIRELLDPANCTHANAVKNPEYDFETLLDALNDVFPISMVKAAAEAEVELLQNRLQRQMKAAQKKLKGTIVVAPRRTNNTN